MFCCTVSKRTSVLSAAVIWCIGVFSTALKGHALLEAAGKLEQPGWFSRLPLAAFCVGTVVGILKGHFMFSKINNKNISRILQMERLPRWHECYRWQFYVFLPTVIATSAVLTKIYSDELAVLLVFGGFDIVVSWALLASAYCFYWRYPEYSEAFVSAGLLDADEGVTTGREVGNPILSSA